MYCDFCKCHMCQTGEVQYYNCDGELVNLETIPVLYHAQTVDGKWICETCYTYDLCAKNNSDPCKGLCKEYKCNHRPILINNEWTFWTYHTIKND